MRGHRRLLGIAALLALGVLAAFLLGRLQSYRETVERGPTAEVRANPYLAAERFLRREGVAVRRAEGPGALDALPGHGHTLLLLADRTHMTPYQAERVLEWTARGGHLVFVAERLWDEKTGRSGDPLLDRLGIRQYLSEDFKVGSPDSAAAPAEPHPELTRFYVEPGRSPVYLAFDDSFHLYDPRNRGTAWANSATATHLLQLAHGAGSVTVLTDSWIWQNGKIGEFDHAWLLWHLTRGSQVVLLHRSAGDALPRLLLRHFPQALLALALLPALALWRAGMRQGPLQPAAAPARRQLEEHLRANADFLLRHGGQSGLLQELQSEIRQRARRRHPGFAQLSEAEQWQQLARLCRLSPEHVRAAMQPASGTLSAVEFTRQVADLQTLRNAL